MAAMSPGPDGAVTRLLQAWQAGDRAALDTLLPLVERELHLLARRQMRHERPDHTLQATALVNEAFLRLAGTSKIAWHDRAHFLAVAARTMRRVLVDSARAKGYQKRGGRQPAVPLDDVDPTAPAPRGDVVAVHDALDALATIDARKAHVVELRYFGGLTVEETADALAVSPETVMRDWKFARAWLLQELQGKSAPGM
jgi:RNA polymerase sigma-70 factor, ECF subfamily